MKKKVLLFTLPILASVMATGCNYFDPFFPVSHEVSSEEPISIPPASIDGEGDKDKQTLNYTMKDYVDNCIYNMSVTPTLGSPKLLVVPILLNDSTTYYPQLDTTEGKAQAKEAIRKAVFGTESETGWHSVKSYYYEESRGVCNIEGSVHDWYTTSYRYEQITDTNIISNIIEAAVNNWKSSHSSEIKSYDTDGDGYLDGVIAIYGAPDYSITESNNKMMWAFTSWTNQGKSTASPNVKNYIWGALSFLETDTTYCNIDAHTLIHETGHLFGLDDYYDYNDTSRIANYNWAGGFSMQDYNVGGHDPFSALAFGWAKPYVPTETCTIELHPFATTGDVIMLTPEYTASPFDEYLLIEYYTPTGLNAFDTYHAYAGKYPSGVTNNGIRLWHVDARLAQINNMYAKQNDYYTDYTLTSNIILGKRYVVGATNTHYDPRGENNSYTSKIQELLNYRLLDLIRRNDYSGSNRGTLLKNAHLFKAGDSFDIANYANSRYFTNTSGSYFNQKVYLNSGKGLGWKISFSTMNNEKAVINLTKTA